MHRHRLVWRNPPSPRFVAFAALANGCQCRSRTNSSISASVGFRVGWFGYWRARVAGIIARFVDLVRSHTDARGIDCCGNRV